MAAARKPKREIQSAAADFQTLRDEIDRLVTSDLRREYPAGNVPLEVYLEKTREYFERCGVKNYENITIELPAGRKRKARAYDLSLDQGPDTGRGHSPRVGSKLSYRTVIVDPVLGRGENVTPMLRRQMQELGIMAVARVTDGPAQPPELVFLSTGPGRIDVGLLKAQITDLNTKYEYALPEILFIVNEVPDPGIAVVAEYVRDGLLSGTVNGARIAGHKIDSLAILLQTAGLLSAASSKREIYYVNDPLPNREQPNYTEYAMEHAAKVLQPAADFYGLPVEDVRKALEELAANATRSVTKRVKAKPRAKERPDLRAARLKATYEILTRETDLENPKLTDAERLTRALHLRTTYDRLRKLDPSFHDNSEQLRLARRLLNSRNHQRRNAAKLAAA